MSPDSGTAQTAPLVSCALRLHPAACPLNPPQPLRQPGVASRQTIRKSEAAQEHIPHQSTVRRRAHSPSRRAGNASPKDRAPSSDRQFAARDRVRRRDQILRLRSRKLQPAQRFDIGGRDRTFGATGIAPRSPLLCTPSQRGDQFRAAAPPLPSYADLLPDDRPRQRLPRLRRQLESASRAAARPPRPAAHRPSNCRSKPLASESIPSIRTTARCARNPIAAIHNRQKRLSPSNDNLHHRWLARQAAAPSSTLIWKNLFADALRIPPIKVEDLAEPVVPAGN